MNDRTSSSEWRRFIFDSNAWFIGYLIHSRAGSISSVMFNLDFPLPIASLMTFTMAFRLFPIFSEYKPNSSVQQPALQGCFFCLRKNTNRHFFSTMESFKLVLNLPFQNIIHPIFLAFLDHTLVDLFIKHFSGVYKVFGLP